MYSASHREDVSKHSVYLFRLGLGFISICDFVNSDFWFFNSVLSCFRKLMTVFDNIAIKGLQ